jgi:hypothetical protein
MDPEQREHVEWLTTRVRAADAAIAQAIKWRRLTFTSGVIGTTGCAPSR